MQGSGNGVRSNNILRIVSGRLLLGKRASRIHRLKREKDGINQNIFWLGSNVSEGSGFSCQSGILLPFFRGKPQCFPEEG